MNTQEQADFLTSYLRDTLKLDGIEDAQVGVQSDWNRDHTNLYGWEDDAILSFRCRGKSIMQPGSYLSVQKALQNIGIQSYRIHNDFGVQGSGYSYVVVDTRQPNMEKSLGYLSKPGELARAARLIDATHPLTEFSEAVQALPNAAEQYQALRVATERLEALRAAVHEQHRPSRDFSEHPLYKTLDPRDRERFDRFLATEIGKIENNRGLDDARKALFLDGDLLNGSAITSLEYAHTHRQASNRWRASTAAKTPLDHATRTPEGERVL